MMMMRRRRRRLFRVKITSQDMNAVETCPFGSDMKAIVDFRA
jgi:hypothetical protein